MSGWEIILTVMGAWILGFVLGMGVGKFLSSEAKG